jgi:hypothetical protein
MASGGSTAVTLFLPSEVTVDTYYKFGPTRDDPVEHWYEFLFDGTTGAEVLVDRVILRFVDGQRGDGDLAENGQIVEPGGPVKIEWPIVCQDPLNSNELRINTDSKTFQFLASDGYDSGILSDPSMQVTEEAITVRYRGESLHMNADAFPHADYCTAVAFDRLGGKVYRLLDPAGVEE